MKRKIFVLGMVILLLVCCVTEKSSWEKAKKDNTMAAYENYMKKYPKSSFEREAIRRLAFLRAAEKNTIKAYDKFLKLHSKSKDLADEARARIEKFHFEEAIKQGSVSSYEKFLKRHPHGNFSGKINQELEELYFQELKKEASITKLEEFQKRYPQGQFSAEIPKMLEKTYFEDAKSRDSVLFYNEFIKRYPASTSAEKAKARIEELYNQRHPVLRQAKSVKLNIDASFPGPVPTEIEDTARRIMEFTGLEVVGSETREFDAQLNIKIEGKAIEGSYTDGSSRYSGASASGSIVFKKNSSTPGFKKFYFRHDPPITTSGRNKFPKPKDAPFEKALNGSNSFAARLIELTAELFGRGIYRSAMRDDSDLIQLAAASILLEKWKEKKPGPSIF
jgi:outer membrane protein assembly factor BamD (BamD/ComL family)